LNFFKSYLLIFLLVTCSISKPLNVDEKTSFYDILPYAQIYIDKTKSLTLNDIRTKEFKQNKKKLLAYGYSPDFYVWVKFTLKNSTDKKIDKIIEFNSPLVDTIIFFEKGKTPIYEGMRHISEERLTINPIFSVYLNPQGERLKFRVT